MVSLSTIVAIDAFSESNGGTEVVPGSHTWNDEQISGEYLGLNGATDPEFNERVEAVSKTITMPAGSCMVFSGTLLHRGGENRSTSLRRAFSNQYCQPWARTQENFYLAIPPEAVAGMSPVLQSLLGYSVHPPFMGQVTASHPLKALAPGFVPPAYRRED